MFPERIDAFFKTGVPGKALEKNVIEVNTIQLRDFAGNKHNRIDDTIYGGGPGMLLQIGPIYRALESLGDQKGKVVMLSASGETWSQELASEFAQFNEPITFLSGYYEGIDGRVSEHLIDREVALGNYVISSGDIAAICIADCISRLIPGYLGKISSLLEESHNESDVLEYPQYTKPRDFMGWKVPDVLTDGNHKEIDLWREANRKKK